MFKRNYFANIKIKIYLFRTGFFFISVKITYQLFEIPCSWWKMQGDKRLRSELHSRKTAIELCHGPLGKLTEMEFFTSNIFILNSRIKLKREENQLLSRRIRNCDRKISETIKIYLTKLLSNYSHKNIVPV